MVVRSEDPKKRRQPIAGRRQKFNLFRALRHPFRPPEPVFRVLKALTVPKTLSIRAPTGGGRNPAAAVL
jgi:hypothetical protein